MSLMTYQRRGRGRGRFTKVVDREMPPWHIDRNVGITNSRTIHR
jgi:hypothetical protein